MLDQEFIEKFEEYSKNIEEEIQNLKVSFDTALKAIEKLRQELDQYKQGFNAWLKKESGAKFD